MILVDTSVWIDHLRSPEPSLQLVMAQGALLMHPFVVAELALGSIPRRADLIASLLAFPCAVPVSDRELLRFVEEHRLFGTGLGMVDGHLLAATAATPEARLWTRDKQLAHHAERLDVAWTP